MGPYAAAGAPTNRHYTVTLRVAGSTFNSLEGSMYRIAALLIALTFASATLARADPLHIVAAENFYGDVAAQIGGSHVQVVSILTNPDEDPHLFEASPSTARAIADADVVIYNGADYDPWMNKLMAASPRPDRDVIQVAEVMGRKSGDNPHLWYDPATLPATAGALATLLGRRVPAHREEFARGLSNFKAAWQAVADKAVALRKGFAGTPVTATEPVFGYMAQAIGLKMRNEGFQLAVMNDTEPSPAQIAAFQDDLRNRHVRVLIYNNQTSDPLTERLRKLATESGVAVVGVSETAPASTHVQDWMLAELNALAAGLAGRRL
jgi:zinc/manganese transport system substrate-binding protein